MLPKHQLFYVIGGFYFCLFAFLAFLLSLPGIGISNTEASPYRILGWVSYCAIESFGSIGVSLFWAFTNSTIDLAGAKKSYGLIVAGAQTGAIAGPTLVNMYAQSMGIPFCYLCGACCMGGMCGIVYLYTERYGSSGKVKSSKKGSAGLVEGLQLFYDHTYVKGIFALSCLFMVEVTILDYTMKVLAKEEFDLAHPDDPHAASQAFAAFMGRFGQSANGLSFCFSLLGTSFVIRRLGLSRTLVLFPTTCLAAVCAVYTAPSLQMVFLVMLTLKGLSYSLNNPCKELLYQPTNAAVKFKAKSWIDVFGARGSKAAGSVVTNAFSDSAVNLVNYGGLVAMGVAGFLIYVATYMGGKFEEFVETGHIVGEDNQDVPTADKEVVMALGQNADDTSCGLEEEGQAPGAGGSGKAERDGVSV
jgi:AAA family ATP:ADP antiporter